MLVGWWSTRQSPHWEMVLGVLRETGIEAGPLADMSTAVWSGFASYVWGPVSDYCSFSFNFLDVGGWCSETRPHESQATLNFLCN